MVKPLIIQVVGYQNSGKTTLTTKLLKGLSKFDLKTVTIKHHGHGGKPEEPGQKDSTKHLSAGAMASIVEGEGKLILQTQNNYMSLEDQIELLGFFHPDVIIIEGHKLENYPKLLLLRDIADSSLITKVNNIKLILYWDDQLKKYLENKTDLPLCSIFDDAAADSIVKAIRDCVHKIDQ